MQIQQDRSRQAECGDCPEQSCAYPFCCGPAMPIAEKILPCRHRATDPKRPKNSTINVVARGRAILGGVCSDRYRLAPLRQWMACNWRSAGGYARRRAFSRSEGPARWSSIFTGADFLNRYFTAERGADALDRLQPDRPGRHLRARASWLDTSSREAATSPHHYLPLDRCPNCSQPVDMPTSEMTCFRSASLAVADRSVIELMKRQGPFAGARSHRAGRALS